MKKDSKKVSTKFLPGLSVVLATHNEAHNLPRCLDSVKGLWDELIVVDGDSTDQTRDIAKQYGAVVVETTNKQNFHINKQMANDLAKFSLVLQLDGDEVVDDELFVFIQGLKKLKTFLASAWQINRKNYFMGRWMRKGGQYPDPVIRLFVNGKARLPQKNVHEQMQVDGQVGTATGHLLHYSNPDFKAYMKKFETYTSFEAKRLFDKQLPLTFSNTVLYLSVKPVIIFLSLFLRHKGILDGWVGFVFALMSGLHPLVAYLKLWELYERK